MTAIIAAAAAMFILVKTNMVIVSEDDGDVTAADRNLCPLVSSVKANS